MNTSKRYGLAKIFESIQTPIEDPKYKTKKSNTFALGLYSLNAVECKELLNHRFLLDSQEVILDSSGFFSYKGQVEIPISENIFCNRIFILDSEICGTGNILAEVFMHPMELPKDSYLSPILKNVKINYPTIYSYAETLDYALYAIKDDEKIKMPISKINPLDFVITSNSVTVNKPIKFEFPIESKYYNVKDASYFSFVLFDKQTNQVFHNARIHWGNKDFSGVGEHRANEVVITLNNVAKKS